VTWHGHFADPWAPYDTSATPAICHICERDEHHVNLDRDEPDPARRNVQRWICEECAEAMALETADTVPPENP
jgi:hypothetical protein